MYKKIMDSPSFRNGRCREAIRSGYYSIDEDLKKGKFYSKEKREN